MAITKEEIYNFLNSDFWGEIRVYLGTEQADAKEELAGLDFSKKESVIKAVAFQERINAIQTLIDKIETMKEDAEYEEQKKEVD